MEGATFKPVRPGRCLSTTGAAARTEASAIKDSKNVVWLLCENSGRPFCRTEHAQGIVSNCRQIGLFDIRTKAV